MSESRSNRFHGIQHDLDNLVDTHLFVLSPNTSGSTLVKNVLGHSAHTWNLKREGQRTFGFVGPRGWDHNRQLIWAARSSWVDDYVRPTNFNWDVTKAAWYSQATASSPTASVFVEKSPPFVLVPEHLAAAFKTARFVLMGRDPYPTFEGIIRRRVPNPPGVAEDARILAAKHIVACLRQQAANQIALADSAVFFTYEQLCADPDACAASITSLALRLDDLDLSRKTPVKGMYDEPLRNMNSDQLKRLSAEDRAIANSVFGEDEDILHHFGYEVW